MKIKSLKQLLKYMQRVRERELYAEEDEFVTQNELTSVYKVKDGYSIQLHTINVYGQTIIENVQMIDIEDLDVSCYLGPREDTKEGEYFTLKTLLKKSTCTRKSTNG